MSLALCENVALTAAEEERLSLLERQVEDGCEIAAAAMRAIRDEGLYRQFGTWDEYCSARWARSKRRIDQILQGQDIIAELQQAGNMFPLLPANDRQARALAPIAPGERAAAWRETVETAPNGKVTAAHVAQVAEAYRAPAPAPAPAAPDRMAVHYSSESPEWYTPPEVIRATLGLLGTIDLDPCSNPGTPNVPAAHWFTAEQDGLSREWFGRVYMNPPYGDAIPAWVEKLCGEHSACRVPEAVALVPARVETRWFRRFRDFPRCFPDGRLRFSGHENSAPFPSAVIYLGDRLDAFAAAFGALGDIFRRVEGDDASLR